MIEIAIHLMILSDLELKRDPRGEEKEKIEASGSEGEMPRTKLVLKDRSRD